MQEENAETLKQNLLDSGWNEILTLRRNEEDMTPNIQISLLLACVCMCAVNGQDGIPEEMVKHDPENI